MENNIKHIKTKGILTTTNIGIDQQKKLKKLDDPVKDDILLANATEWRAIIARRQSLWEMPVQHGEASFP